MLEPEPLQPIPGDSVVRLFNAQLPIDVYGPILSRALRSMSPTERGRERDRFLRRAAALMPAASPYMLALRIRARMESLVRAFPGFLDEGLPEGLIGAALLVCSLKVPSAKTIQRAIQH